jgi:hypothetical protein
MPSTNCGRKEKNSATLGLSIGQRPPNTETRVAPPSIATSAVDERDSSICGQ